MTADTSVGSSSGRPRAERLPAAALLVALSAIAPLSIDMFLPSLPTMTEEFSASKATMQLAVTLFIVSFAASQLVYGPLSDRVGRRPALTAGLVLFVLGGFISLSAGSAEMLIAGRVVQGLGGGAGPALAQAMVLDVYGRERAARVLAYMAIALPLAPAVAPIIGGFLHEAWGWHSVFVTLAGLGAFLLAAYYLLLPETHPPRAPGAERRRLLADYRTVLSSRTYVAYALVMGLMFSGQLVFISSSAFVLIEELGLDERVYGFSFAFVALGIMAGATISSRLVARYPSQRVVLLGATTSAAASAVMAALAWTTGGHLATILLPMFVTALGLGITRPSAMAGALVPFPQIAGLASGLLGFSQMVIASSVNIGYSALFEASARTLATGVWVAVTAGLLSVLVLRPGRASLDVRAALSAGD
jgi:DHA1 family bicyclomycin/chloramphenicol resistance-like MFS transporter